MANTQNSFKLQHTFSGHAGAVYSIATDNQFVYSASTDKFVVRWDLHLMAQDKFAIKFEFTPYSICLFHENAFLAVGLANGNLHFFDIQARKELKFYTQHKTGIFSIAENPNKHQLYVGDADGNLSVWDTNTFELLIYLPFNCGKIRKIISSMDGNQFFMASQDGNIRIFDSVSFNEIACFYAHKDGATALLQCSENELISGGKDAHLKFLKLDSLEFTKALPAHNFVIYDLIQLKDSIFISASRDKSMKVWNLENRTVLTRIERKEGGHAHSVNQLARICDTQFVSCSDDGTIKVWELN